MQEHLAGFASLVPSVHYISSAHYEISNVKDCYNAQTSDFDCFQENGVSPLTARGTRFVCKAHYSGHLSDGPEYKFVCDL